MRKFVKASVLPVAALALACGRGSSSDQAATLPDDLRKDLQAASASGLELASAAQNYAPQRVVSAIESPATSAPVKRRSRPRPVAKRTSSTEPSVARAPDPVPENKIDVAEPQPSVEAPAPAIDTPTDVAVVPRPTPVGSAPAPTDAGSGGIGDGSRGGGLGGVGEAIGTIIGVVITQGGAGGIDHCDPRVDRRRGRGGIFIPNSQIPRRPGTIPNAPFPVRMTFPR